MALALRTTADTVARDRLKKLVPPESLGWSEFYSLVSSLPVEVVPPGARLFAAGAPAQIVYLLKGEITVSAEEGPRVVEAGSGDGKQPIGADVNPVARSAAHIVRVERAKIASHSLDGDRNSIHVKDLDESLDDTADWMTRLVQSPAFRQLPPAKIHALILRLQELPVRAGQTIMRQGEQGDNYYIILRGECEVVRENARGARVVLARLGKGQSFGEESLLSASPRNATVEMVTDGLLMSLPKRDFDELVREPLLQEVDADAARERIAAGAVPVDVRAFEATRGLCVPGSVNIPLYLLRIKVHELDAAREHICYCDDERESVVAAFLMSAWGLNACVLRGGLEACDPESSLFG